ncbi:MAG: rhomboid family intramembrane serine protease [Gemmatimonadetes bacterium]|nr:rhomboid family intramembrane serine protease [Gemmatimonadota bacterium]
MIPFKDENPTEIVTYVTYLFLAINIGVWILVQGAGDMEALQASVTSYGAIPCQITGECPPRGLTWEALFTSMFMHGSWEHLLGNMLFLWVFGNNIEDSMGHLRFIVFYLVCGVAAALAHVYLAPASPIPTVGASGAISGIMGAYIVLYPTVRVRTFFPPFFFFNLRAFIVLGYWFLIQLMMGVVTLGPEAGEQGGVAFWAHIGGFVAGLVLIKPFEKTALVSAKRNKVKLSREEVARLEW